MEATILASVDVAGRTVTAALGDITEASVDAIVNPANGQLAHGGGIAGAIVSRGGWEIQEESAEHAPVAVGSAVVTGAGRLPCRWVIHAVGPVWGDGDEEHKLRSAVSASLDRANELSATSVALPAISTGIFGYPKDRGTRSIADEVMRWLSCHPACAVRTVHLMAFDRQTAELFASALSGDA